MRSGNKKSGITLLLSLLITAALFTVALSVADLTIKEFELSALGRESQRTYYAAETGFDCANYWQVKQEVFSTTGPAVTISCNGVPRGSYNRAATQAKWDTIPVGTTPVIDMTTTGTGDYFGQPVRVIVQPPLTTPNVAIQVTAENTGAPSYARKVQRTFGGLAGACFQDADIMLVLDISESIAPDLPTVKADATALINILGPTPSGRNIGIVTFGIAPGSDNGGGGFCQAIGGPLGVIDTNNTEKVCMRSPLSGDEGALTTVISLIGSSELGTTDMGDAIMLAVQELYNNDRPDGTNPDYIIMISDGAPNITYFTETPTHDSPFFDKSTIFPFSPVPLPFGLGIPPWSPAPIGVHVHNQNSPLLNDHSDSYLPPNERLIRAEASSAATVAKGPINNIDIYALGINIDPTDETWMRTRVVSSPNTKYYYPVAGFAALSTEVQKLGTCQGS